MRQVPNYLLIGNGRVSCHFQFYFTQLGLAYTVWSRDQPISALLSAISRASHLLLLIPDDAIEPFINEHLIAVNKSCIHFSGSLVLECAFGAHPLMTFSDDLYELEHYLRIPFVLDHDAPDFSELLPGLPNIHQRLDKSLKAKYHAYCVMSGNFTCLLWQKFFTTLHQEFHLSPEISHPYLLRQMQNLIGKPQSALTGPLVRGDIKTIENNLKALESDPLQEIYKKFVVYYANHYEESR